MPRLGFLFVLLVIAGSAQICLAITGVPSLVLSEANIAYSGPGVPSLLVVPDGTGNPFTEAHDEAGAVVDATITMVLRDPQGHPITNFPLEDLWLESDDGGLVSCTWGPSPDNNTDVNGMTQWTQPALAGGHSQGPVFVLINGSRMTSNEGVPLRFNSPDLNGDGIVHLTDVGFFSSDYYSGYNFRSDLNGDGQLNLSDVALIARSYGAQCP